MVPFLLFPSDYFSILSFKLLPLSCFFLPTTPVKSVLQMILRSHRDGNEGAIFSTDQGRREREAHGRGRASKQAREKKGGRDGRKSLFLCVAAVGGSELRQGRGDETRGRIRDPTAKPGSRRDPSQVGRHSHHWPQYKPGKGMVTLYFRFLRLTRSDDSKFILGLGPEML